jgi:cytoskeletal protein CcmA (bactofilin family)
MKKIMDLKIYGQGSSGGGKFEDVIIKGNGQISGDVECKNYKVYGNTEMEGNLKSDFVEIKGRAEFEGDLIADVLKIQGEVQIIGDLTTDEALITGNIKADGDFNAEIFTLEGGFEIDGLLNADILNINMYWPCKVSEIGGTEIKVRKEEKFSFLGLKNMIMPHSKTKLLKADTIEADEIYLENTQAKIVRGNNIKLGPECIIELVEYKESFQNDENSKVIHYKKL